MVNSIKTVAIETTKVDGEKTSIQATSTIGHPGRKIILEQRREVDILVHDFLENEPFYRKGAHKKHINLDFKNILILCEEWRKNRQKLQELEKERNLVSKLPEEEAIKKGLVLKQKHKKIDETLVKKAPELKDLLLQIPNPPKDDVEDGKDESENKVVRKHGEPKHFGFIPKDHVELGTSSDIIDIERAAKVSGSRFGYLKNEAVLLEFALVQLALGTLIKEGFVPVVPPVLIKKEITEGLGYWQAGGNEDYYWVHEPQENQGLYLVGTAEHSIVPMHRDEIFNGKELPKRYVGFSTCFRREAGSYGKDTRGILRVHQFDKVEMVSFTAAENDDQEHEYFLSLEEKLWQSLEIPYQVVKMCTGDLGFPTARKYDIEAWIPSQNKYREVTSTSTTTDFQARRLNIKYKDGNDKKYVHILNGTAFAIGRTIIAILENYQQKDGSIKIPKVLQKYVGKSVILPS